MPEGQIQSEVLRVPTGPAPWDTDASSNLVSLSRKVLKPQRFWDFFFFVSCPSPTFSFTFLHTS